MIVIRLGQGLLTLIFVSIFVFFGIELLPGDVAEAILGQNATPETLAVIRERLDLDQPAVIRYLAWLKGLSHGDLGVSLSSSRDVAEQISLRLPTTLLLGGVSAAIAVPLALALGLVSAMYPNSVFDRSVSNLTLIVVSGPEFLIATLLVLVFAVTLQLAPAVSYLPPDASFQQYARALILPAMTLCFAVLAPMVRMTRSAVLNVMASPAIEMAILKGVPRPRIILWHALPNAIAPIINVIAINVAYLITGIVVIEVVFSFPGLGKLMVDGVQNRDIPVVQACAMLFCSVYIGFYILADLVTILANPRLRYPK